MIVYDAVNPSLHNRDLPHAGRQSIKFVIEKCVTTEQESSCVPDKNIYYDSRTAGVGQGLA